jgi:site-specific DNA-methyltransferase (adenine-specific)
LRRSQEDKPFEDVIVSERTPKRERQLANHPSIKPQSLLRRLVYAALPLGIGTIVDPFMGSGSTVAACEAMGLCSIGVERNPDYFLMAKKGVPKLAAVMPGDPTNTADDDEPPSKKEEAPAKNGKKNGKNGTQQALFAI